MSTIVNRISAPVARIGSSALFIASLAAVMGSMGSLPFQQAKVVATAPSAGHAGDGCMLGLDATCIADMPGVPLSLCFVPGTSAEEVKQVTQGLVAQWANDSAARPAVGDGDGGAAYFIGTRWAFASSSTQGTPVVLTWSMPPDGLLISDGITGGAASANNLNATFVTKFGTLDAGKSLIRQVFARWSELSGVTYTEVTDDNAAWGASGSSTRGDIRITGRAFGSTGVLAYTYFPNNGDMVFVTTNSNYWSTTNNNRYFRNICSHEHGHGLGFDHVCPTNNSKLMEPYLTTAFDGPQNDDLRAVQREYGDHYEPNDTIATASAVINASGTTTIANLSIDDNSDVDYYKFNANVGATITVQVTPQGPSTYLNGAQNSNGTCSAGTAVYPLVVQDIVVGIYRGTSTTPIIQQNATVAGSAEAIVNFAITASDVYAIKVSTAALTDDIQLYTLYTNIVATAPRIGDFDGNGIVNGGDLGILLAVWGPITCGSRYDLNNDCVIDGGDLGIFLADWG